MRRLFFGSQFYVQFQKTVTSFMQFQKTVTSFMCSFKKLSRVSCSFKKLSLVSCLVSKKNVTFVCSSGETIRHFAKRKTRLQVVILTACKKTFFRVSKNVKPQLFFLFFPIWWFFKKTEEKKTQISFLNCKNSQFYASEKNVFLQIYTSTSTFTKLAWNCPQFHGSFTETDLKLKKRP